MRTTVRAAIVAAAAVVVALVAPVAAASATDVGPVIASLPALVTGGGAGTPAATTAVSTTCASGAPLAAAEWFTLQQSGWGAVVVDAKREIESVGHRPDIYSATHVALVDLGTSTVLQCGGGPVTVSASQSVAIVAWVDPVEWQVHQDNCTTFAFDCTQTTTVYVDRSAPVPSNDTVASARTISSLPYTDSGNSVRASSNDPQVPGSCAFQSDLEAQNYGSVWWRWTAPADGVVDVKPTSTSGLMLCTGLIDATGGGTAPVPTMYDADLLPTTHAAVTAGHTYLVAVFTAVDSYYRNDPLQHGGPFTLDVSWVTRGPGPVVGLTTESAGSDGISVSWQPPVATTAAAAVTGYHVSVVKHASNDVPLTLTVGPDVVSHTFTGLVAGASYDIAVHALSDAGDGEKRTRVFSLADAGVYGAAPGPPASLLVRRATSAVTVVWTAPTYDGTTDVTGYRVRVYLGLTRTLVTTATVGDVRTVRVGGLRNGVAYTVDVSAINAAGPGTPSRRSNLVVPASRPGAPTIGRAYPGVPGGATSAFATWLAPRATGGAPIRGYIVRIWRYNASGHLLSTRATALLPATARRAILRLPSGYYRFSVRAVNVMGVGATSSRSNLVVAR